MLKVPLGTIDANEKPLFYKSVIDKRQGQSANFGQSELTYFSENCVVMSTDSNFYVVV